VESSFDGGVDPNLPQLIWLKGPCTVDVGSGNISGTLTAPAYDGAYKAGYRFTNPAGGSSGQFRFAVYLGDSLVREFRTPVSCPTGCTLFSEWDIRVYAGFTFSPQSAVIGSGGTNTFGAVESTSTVPCSPGMWITNWPIELEITKGQDVGSFVDGGKRTYTVVKKKSEFTTFGFLADGQKGYGDVEITARSGGITVVKGFKVVAPAPRVHIVPPWWWYGQAIKLSFDNLPILEFGETHTPGPGQKFEPVITWEPDNIIRTADYYGQFDETMSISVKVKAENPGGTAQDSLKLTLTTECIKVNFDPTELSPGDTASLSFQRKKSDGTFEDIVGEYAFDVKLVGGEENSRGQLLAGEEVGTELSGASRPIKYIAPTVMEVDSLVVQLLAAAWEVIWGKKDELRGQRPGKQQLSVKQAEGSRGREQGGKAESMADSATRRTQAKPVETALKAELSSSWCPVSQVVVKGSALHHFVVTVQPDTVEHGDTATVHVQAKDKDNQDIRVDGETLLSALLDAAGQTYGKLIGATMTGPLVEISYWEIQVGELRFVADGDNPIGLEAQQVKISLVLSEDETKEGVGTVAVLPSIEKFCQSNPDWAGLDYDKYIDPAETKKQGKTVYYKIGRKGCALGCMAMVAKAGGANVNPRSLNEWMTGTHGFRGTEGGVVWGAIDGFDGNSKYKSSPTFQGSGLQYHDDGKTVDLESSSTVSLSSMDPYLEKGALIAAAVYNPSTKNAHWVLVVGKSSDGYRILDPGCYQDRTTLGGEYANSVYKFMVYHRK
jgi:hypothetical protein